MNTKIPPELLMQEAQKRGLISSGPSMEPGLPDLLKSSFAGSIKGLEQVGANVLNTPAALSNKLLGTKFEGVQVPEEIDPTQQLNLSQHPFAKAAEVIPQLFMPVIANQLLQHFGLGKMPLASLPKRAASAAGIGYATGPGMEEGKEAFALGSAAIPVIGGLSERGIGKKVTALTKQQHQQYSDKYRDLFNKVEELPGENKLRVPSSLQSQEVNKFFEGLSPKYKQSLRRYIDNPTFKNAHDAQSDLKAGERNLKNKKNAGTSLTQQEEFVAQKTKDYVKRIQGEMMRFLTEKNAPEYAKEYSDITKGFAREIGPLKFKEAEIAKEGKKKISPARVGKAALTSPELETSEVAEQIPGYLMRKKIEPAMPLIKTGGSILGGGAILSASPYLPSYIANLVRGLTGK